ncbi:50S ribosomal protein L33 [Streptococcus pneumoniae]|uniref:50S ribosomal protein L33 n=1 Tax=Streptococcus pneumoniae TaxID=1313 RepID=UPI000776C723|nr:50S ribosomal protein L33 [Streptococcus pneumoniae]KXW20100.1 50S ribosomal protein L33 [Streptococcus pneumoniae]
MKSKGKLERVKMNLKCSSYDSINYVTSKNSETHQDVIEVLKYCPKKVKVSLNLESK